MLPKSLRATQLQKKKHVLIYVWLLKSTLRLNPTCMQHMRICSISHVKNFNFDTMERPIQGRASWPRAKGWRLKQFVENENSALRAVFKNILVWYLVYHTILILCKSAVHILMSRTRSTISQCVSNSRTTDYIEVFKMQQCVAKPIARVDAGFGQQALHCVVVSCLQGTNDFFSALSVLSLYLLFQSIYSSRHFRCVSHQLVLL